MDNLLAKALKRTFGYSEGVIGHRDEYLSFLANNDLIYEFLWAGRDLSKDVRGMELICAMDNPRGTIYNKSLRFCFYWDIDGLDTSDWASLDDATAKYFFAVSLRRMLYGWGSV